VKIVMWDNTKVYGFCMSQKKFSQMTLVNEYAF